MIKSYISVMALMIITPCLGFVQNFGSRDHVMNKFTDNASIINYWEEQNPFLNELFLTVESILSVSKEADYSDVIRDVTYRKIINDNNIKILGGPMLGDIRADGVSIWVRTALPALVSINIMNSSYQQVYGPQLTSTEEDLTTVFEIEGLEPRTKYFYSLEINGEVVTALDNNYFTTAPVEETSNPIRIAFGSCPHRWGLGNRELWRRIRSRDPHAMLVLGDIAVQDRNDHFGMHRADYLARDLQPVWREFVSKVPIYASWDDHDYFDNDKGGLPEGYVEEDKEGVWKVFKDSWNNPSYGLDGKGVFTKTRIGQCDVIMTDSRYFREKGNLLGDTQMTWLKNELSNSKAPFIILSSGSMWSDYVSKGKDSWGAYDPDGREEILSYIQENNIGGVILISGDRHGARGFTIPRESGMEFYEFEAASLGGRVGPRAQDDSWNTQLYGYDGVFAFGELTIYPEGDNPFFIYRLIKENGDILYEKKVFRTDLIPKKFSVD